MRKNESNDVKIIGGNGITAGENVIVCDVKGPVSIGNTYIYKHIYEDVENTTKLLIEIAQLYYKSRDYDKALNFYEQARIKLEKNESKILLVKVIMGEAVCHQKKGDLSRSKDLIFEAKCVDPKNSTVLANIASHLLYENSEEAEIYAKKALEFDQNNFLAKCVMGLLEYDKGNVIESLSAFKQASRINSNVGYPFSCMAYVYSCEGDFENAIKYGKEAIKVEPEEAIFLMELSVNYMNRAFPENKVCTSSEFSKIINMEYVDKALLCLEKAKDLSESQSNNCLNCEIYMYLSKVYLAKREFKKSIEYCDMALNGGLDTIDVHKILGEAYGECKDYDKVIEHYEPLIKKESLTMNDLFIVKANLAVAYSFKNLLHEAEKLFEELIDANPENITLYIQLSSVLEKNGYVEKAFSVLEKMDRATKKPWDFYYMKGILYHKKGDYESSAQSFKEAIYKDSKAILPRIKLINLYMECGMHEYAVKQARELVHLDPTGDYFYKLASLFCEIGDYTESVIFAKKALEVNYDNVETYRLLCLSLLLANKAREAKDELENALKKYPDDLILKLNYSSALSTLENTEKSIEILNQIISNDPKCISAYKGLARIYYKEASYEKALEYSKKAVFMEPEDEDAHFVMGCSLLMLGKKDEAFEEIQNVVRINPNFDNACLINAEEGIEFLINQIMVFNSVIEKYKNGTITISKAGEILQKDTFDLFCYINNIKVAESLNLSDNKLDQLRNSPITKRDVLVDETVIGILAKIGNLDLLKITFDHVYIIKELEEKIVSGPYLKDHPYREVKNRLQIIDGGWIKSLIPSDVAVFATKKIIYENELSKSDISFISSALDKGLICLTEDLLQRIQLDRINRPTCGIIGFIKYAINKNTIKVDDAKKILDNVEKICIIGPIPALLS